MSRAAAAALVAAVILVAVAGCTSGGPARSSPASSPSDAPDAPPSAVTTSSSAITVPPSTSTAPPTKPSTATSTLRPTARPSRASVTTAAGCPSLSVMIVPGGAAPNTQIAGLLFTNTGSAACTLTGYPTVHLVRGDQPVGAPSRPGSGAESVYRLRPGAEAESRLTDDVRSCSAPIADGALVTAPGATVAQAVSLAVPLRACVLRVGALGPPD